MGVQGLCNKYLVEVSAKLRRLEKDLGGARGMLCDLQGDPGASGGQEQSARSEVLRGPSTSSRGDYVGREEAGSPRTAVR